MVSSALWIVGEAKRRCVSTSRAVVLSSTRFEQTLDLRVEISGHQKSCLTSVRSEEARHRVVRQVHSISAFVDEDRDSDLSLLRDRPAAADTRASRFAPAAGQRVTAAA
jgi:hypothetical protein